MNAPNYYTRSYVHSARLFSKPKVIYQLMLERDIVIGPRCVFESDNLKAVHDMKYKLEIAYV